jgi:hypothetical protein
MVVGDDQGRRLSFLPSRQRDGGRDGVLVRGPHDLVALADIQTRFPQERLGRFA